MSVDPTGVTPSLGPLWAGRILTGSVVLFLAFDGLMKVIEIPQVLEASGKLGLPANTIVGVGMLLLACTALYAVPRTAVLGALVRIGLVLRDPRLLATILRHP